MCQEIYDAAFDFEWLARSTMAYFYFSFNQPSTLDPTAFLRPIVAQLCLTDSLLPQLSDLYKKSQGWAPSYESLFDILTFVIDNGYAEQDIALDSSRLEGRRGPIFLVLDAIDEIPIHREKFLKLVCDLASLKSERLRILITSRQQPGIEAVLNKSSGYDSYQIPATEVEVDIQQYVEKQIAGHFRLQSQSEEVKTMIRTRLSRGGM